VKITLPLIIIGVFVAGMLVVTPVDAEKGGKQNAIDIIWDAVNGLTDRVIQNETDITNHENRIDSMENGNFPLAINPALHPNGLGDLVTAITINEYDIDYIDTELSDGLTGQTVQTIVPEHETRITALENQELQNYINILQAWDIPSGQSESHYIQCPATHPYFTQLDEITTGNSAQAMRIISMNLSDQTRATDGSIDRDAFVVQVLNDYANVLVLRLSVTCSDQP